MQRTIPALWQKAARRESNRARVPGGGGGRLARGLLGGGVAPRRGGRVRAPRAGIEKGDVIGIMAATRLEWALADFALARIGAVTAPIYPDQSAGDCAYMLGLVEASGVFLDEERRSTRPRPSRTSSHWRRSTSSRSADARTASSTPTRSPGRRARSARTTCSPSSTRPARPGRRRAA